ncbi:MAG TPA: HEAT repeat domain-containing protein, partial [Pyrinomonadaceae bacterium]|nr:HEAT repeat domain-containing protein [Pyrinomonadaceae bacterium]
MSAATLLCVLAFVALTWGALSSLAQGGRTRQQQQSASQNQPKLKLTPLRSADSAKGSRVTITGTDSLGDYQSYRSGERFYVRIPNADAAAVRGGVRGRGFEDAQVQRSGGDVILSFRVKPGARPSVKQRFNQLDVEFAAPEGAANASAQTAGGQTSEQRATSAATTSTSASQPSSSQATSPTETAEARRAAEQRAQTASAARSAGENPPSATDLPDQLTPAQSAQGQTTTQADPATTAAPAETPTEIAQATQPAQNPASTTTTTTAPATSQPSASLGAAVARNWKPLAVVAAILAVGLGLFFVARRSSAQTPPPPPATVEEVAAAKTAKLKEADAPAHATAAPTLAKDAATTFAATTAVATGKKKKKARLRAEAAARAEAAKAEALSVAEMEASAAPQETAAVEASAPGVAETFDEAKVDETSVGVASIVAPLAATGAEAFAESSTAVEPVAVVYDAEAVQNETRLLLEGESYDAAVFASGDRTTRQMIAAELLAALAARNPARKERARTAFIEYGYFNEAAKDLRAAEAPAERASAARSLGLVGDRLATPHLESALEDSSVEVRRAAVEAFASVRDPEAVEALESLISREKSLKTKVPRKVVQRAIEACAEAPALAPPSLAAATASTLLAAEATRAEVEAPAASVTEVEEATPTAAETTPSTVEATPPAAEATPTVVEESTPTAVEESTPTAIEEATPTLLERADETLVEEPATTLVEEPTETLAESATPTIAESAASTLLEEATTPTFVDAPAPETAIVPVEEEAA